ncbi:MAG: peptidoglycan editing factor PgeF [Deltaproteobacteria bacterium]|nr:peptidoglycan editing factor PgeF [Deltaproteobacteria bacterium]
MKQYNVHVHEGVKFYSVPVLEALPEIRHGFSTRIGGVSAGAYGTMNLSLNVGEDPDLVEINRCVFIKALEAGNPEVYTVKQVHGSRVIRIERKETPAVEFRQAEADAIVTDQPGVAVGVLTADCVPVLLYDPVHRVIAAVHAGRAGSLRSILSHVVRRMAGDFHSLPAELYAAVGPAIERDCYEVGEEIAEEVEHLLPEAGEVLSRRKGSVYLDLRKMNHLALLGSGLEEDRIFHVDLCTACHPRTFYSYRKNGGGETGRMMALIMLREEE